MPVAYNPVQMPTACKVCKNSADTARFQGFYMIMTKGCKGQLRPIDLNALVLYTHETKLCEQCHNE